MRSESNWTTLYMIQPEVDSNPRRSVLEASALSTALLVHFFTTLIEEMNISYKQIGLLHLTFIYHIQNMLYSKHVTYCKILFEFYVSIRSLDRFPEWGVMGSKSLHDESNIMSSSSILGPLKPSGYVIGLIS